MHTASGGAGKVRGAAGRRRIIRCGRCRGDCELPRKHRAQERERAPFRGIAIDPADPNGLFVGTDVGVFHSTNGGASWSSYNQGLPNVAVSDLKFHPVSGDLVASTYGRGVFRIRGTGPGGGPLLPTANFTFSPSPPAPAQNLAFLDLSTGTPTAWKFAG